MPTVYKVTTDDWQRQASHWTMTAVIFGVAFVIRACRNMSSVVRACDRSKFITSANLAMQARFCTFIIFALIFSCPRAFSQNLQSPKEMTIINIFKEENKLKKQERLLKYVSNVLLVVFLCICMVMPALYAVQYVVKLSWASSEKLKKRDT